MNMSDYLIWRGDIPVTQSPFNAVDALILSQAVYSHFHGVGDGAGSLFREAGPEAEKHFPNDQPRTVVSAPDDVMLAAAATRRFGDCVLCEYADEIDEDEEKQFAAATFLTPDGAVNVVYRGTDDSLVGWKEDFNLAFATPVPAQIRALDYLNRVARLYDGPLRVIGIISFYRKCPTSHPNLPETLVNTGILRGVTWGRGHTLRCTRCHTSFGTKPSGISLVFILQRKDHQE